MAFHDRLKEARRNRGLTQEQLGSAIGAAKSTITGYEKGKSEPSVAKINELMQVLGVDANFLYQDEMASYIPTPTKKDALSDNRTLKVANQFYKLDEHGKVAVECITEVETARMAEPIAFPEMTDEEAREIDFAAFDDLADISEEDILDDIKGFKEFVRRKKEEEGKNG